MEKLYAGMQDTELRRAWEEAMDWETIRRVEHEMAMRYMHKARGSGRYDYLTEKFLQMPMQFTEACARK